MVDGGDEVFERFRAPLVNEVQNSQLVVVGNGTLIGYRQTKPQGASGSARPTRVHTGKLGQIHPPTNRSPWLMWAENG